MSAPTLDECIEFQERVRQSGFVFIGKPSPFTDEILNILRSVKKAREDSQIMADHRESRYCDGCY